MLNIVLLIDFLFLKSIVLEHNTTVETKKNAEVFEKNYPLSQISHMPNRENDFDDSFKELTRQNKEFFLEMIFTLILLKKIILLH